MPATKRKGKKVVTSKACFEIAIENIENDRAIASTLLTDVTKHVAQSKERYDKLGIVMAKFLEVLQRSNEQLVKIGALKTKKSVIDEDMSDEEKEELFDIIQKESEEGHV